MLDWKILAASIVALLVVSSVFVGGLGLRGILSGIMGKIEGYLGTSPFSGLLTADTNDKTLTADKNDISLLLSQSELVLNPDKPASITIDDASVTGFSGEMMFSFANKTVSFDDTFRLTTPFTTLSIEPLILDTLSLKGIPFEIQPDISTDEGNLELKAFSGTATATRHGLLLKGRVQSLAITIGDLTFALE